MPRVPREENDSRTRLSEYDPSEFLLISKVVALTKINKNHFYNAIARGQLRAFVSDSGRVIRVQVQDLLDYLERQKTGRVTPIRRRNPA